MRPRARLINLIGEELISDEPVALVELVKNAYDADARNVEIRFEGADLERPSRIIIADDGTGMDVETVLGAWLEPGTTSKKRVDRSPGGRLYQGAKGIGRFAAARLGDSLLLETRRAGQEDTVLVLLYWGKFTDDDYLDDIEVEYETIKSNQFAPGTRLTIEGLKSGSWEDTNYEQLHARLSRLISPFDDIDDFDILLDVPGNEDISGLVEPPDFLLKPKYQLKGNLESNGRFVGEIEVDGKRSKIDRQIGPKNELPECGQFVVEIRAWDRDREGLQPIASREDLAISQVRKILDIYSGVSIYRDGFRIHPYGERGDDWLNLDLRSRQNPVRNLANNQIIAAIRISRDENPDLRDRSTREGMVKNSAHQGLENWFKRVLTILEEERYKVRPRKEIASRSDPLFEPFDFSQTIQEARQTLGTKHPVTQLIEETEKQVTLGVEQVQEVFSRLLMSAGLGHMVDIVIHEIGAPLGKINRQLIILERQLSKIVEEDDRKKIEPSFAGIKGWLEQIHHLRQRLDPQTPGKRGRAVSFNVADEIRLTFELYQSLIDKQGIKVEIVEPKTPIKARMSKAVIAQVLANLVDNGLYWITHRHGSTNGGEICVTLQKLEHGFSVRVTDDGPGISVDNREMIFEPYYSTKPNGIGLGLYIARLLIEPYGKLLYKDGKKLGGACFEARFEKGVGL